jgi:hypothetical protein
MALDRTYFTGELSIPMLSTAKGDKTGVAALLEQGNQVMGEYSLEWFIARYEEEFLRKLLGDRLYEAYSEGIAAETPLQIWSDLKSRIYGERGGFKFSPAANYVYFFIQTHAVSKTAMTGEIKFKGDHSVNVSPARKMVTAWNGMCDMVYEIWAWIREHYKEISEAMQSEFIGNHFYGCRGHDLRYINEFGI